MSVLEGREFGIPDNPTVNGDATGQDPAGGFSTGTDPELGKDARQPMARRHGAIADNWPVRCVAWTRAGAMVMPGHGRRCAGRDYFLASGAGAAGAAGAGAAVPAPLATRTPRAFIQASNSSAVMRLPFWFMSKRHGVLSYWVFGL